MLKSAPLFDVLRLQLQCRLHTRRIRLERGTPMQSTKLKRLKGEEQESKCAICGKAREQKGSELDRAKASDGYTVENTRLVHHKCHVADQKTKELRYSDGEFCKADKFFQRLRTSSLMVRSIAVPFM